MEEMLKMIKCIKCGEDMPELRLTKFGYEVCVNCSTTGAYKAVSTVNGVGDHTWNDIQIVTAEQSKQLSNQKKTKLLDSYKDINA
tara:strand:- start:50 stop:304 length:255 start_codon:yes stop_codon:yes gene_type:complete